MTNYHYADMLSCRRGVLAALGVGLWTTKVCQTKQVPAWQSRLSQKTPKHPMPDAKPILTKTPLDLLMAKGKHDAHSDIDRHQKIKKISADDQMPSAKHVAKPAIISKKIQTPQFQSHQRIQTAKDDKDMQQTSLATSAPKTVDEIILPFNLPPQLCDVHLHVDRFSLYGVRFGDWLLFVDATQMDTKTLGIWQSLTQALQKEAAMVGRLFITLHARYPLCDDGYAQFANFHQGLVSLLGFLTRLYDTNVQSVGLLTTLVGVDLGGELMNKQQNVPTLAQMSYNIQTKKQLWQQLIESF